MTDGWRELYDLEYPRLLRALLAIGGDLSQVGIDEDPQALAERSLTELLFR